MAEASRNGRSSSNTEYYNNPDVSSDATEGDGVAFLAATSVTPQVATGVTPLAATALAVVAIVCGRRLRKSRRKIESIKNRLESIKKHQ